jgi:uncharacterized protein (DUF2062 family)
MNLHDWLRQHSLKLLAIRDTPEAIAGGVAIGFFFGFTPLIGLKTLCAIFLAWLTRSNIIAAVIAGALHDLLLPFMPVIYISEFKLGYWILHHEWPHQLPRIHRWHEWRSWTAFLTREGKPLLLGSLVCALPTAAASYYIVRQGIIRHRRTKQAAVQTMSSIRRSASAGEKKNACVQSERRRLALFSAEGLLHQFDLRYGEHHLPVFLMHGSCRFDLGRMLAEVFVEILAEIVLGKVILDGFAVLRGLNDVLAMIGLLQSALGALPLAGDGDFRIGGEGRNGDPREGTRQHDAGYEFFHRFLSVLYGTVVNLTCAFPDATTNWSAWVPAVIPAKKDAGLSGRRLKVRVGAQLERAPSAAAFWVNTR